MKGKFIFFSLIFVSLAISCQQNKFDVNTDNIQVSLHIHRLDKDLFLLDVQNLEKGIPQLAKDYKAFWLLYNYQILHLGNPQDSLYPVYLKKFLIEKTIREVHAETEKKFSNLHLQQNNLEKAFRHFKYYFPEMPIPEIYTYISGFNQSVVTDSATIGISLDKYLGKNCRFYNYLQMPLYQRRRLIPQKITNDVMEAYARMEFAQKMNTQNLLSHIIYEGKIQYFLSAMLPDYPDTLKLNYTHKQLLWAKKYEKDSWTYLVEKKLLFSNDALLIRNMTGEAPFTKTFGKDSAPQAGVFIGKKIVEGYMVKHPGISLGDLMKKSDANLILQQSGYNP